jgi:hypothetical protein
VNRLEDRLRRDLRARAEDVTRPSVPPLHLPGPPGHRSRSRWHRGSASRPAWVTPLAAAAAVTAVIAGTFTAAQAIYPPAPRPQVPAATSGLTGLPPYYVSLPRDYRSTAVVARTATGAVIATLHAPRPFMFSDDNDGDCAQSLSAAGDQEFVLKATAQQPGVLAAIGPAVRLFLLRVTPAGGVSLTALRLPDRLGGNQSLCYALSPDGRRLALTFTPNPDLGSRMVVQVVTLATGQVRQWSYTSTLRADPVRNLTWVTPRILAFYVPFNAPDAPTTTAPPRRDTPGTYLLNTAAAGHSLLTDSRRLTGEQFEVHAATPDGTRLIVNHYGQPGTRAVLDEVSVRTGQVVQTFGTCVDACLGGAEAVLWSDPSGDRLVVAKPLKNSPPGQELHVIGALAPGGAFTPLRPQPHVEGQLPGLAW